MMDFWIEEPLAEPLVRGPRLGFNDNLVDNITILRQLGETDSLTILPFQVGLGLRKRDLIIAYIADIADPNVVREVSSRIKKIDVDHIRIRYKRCEKTVVKYKSQSPSRQNRFLGD
ncbi:spore germination protein [Brevibacillus porteri]|uniref:spore germination protein n=1 Tax=Brevibacillus porteri TaxID=2126350 RepID=UPI003D1CCAA6